MTDPQPMPPPEGVNIDTLAAALQHRGETLHDAVLRAVQYGDVVQQLQHLPVRMAVARERLRNEVLRRPDDPEALHSLALGLAALVKGRDHCVLVLHDAGFKDDQLRELAHLSAGQLLGVVRRARAGR